MRELIVPLHRLPPGYEKALRNPPNPPVEPRPAATLALLRAGAAGLEVLLLKRTPRARFIPGAYVFPGGRVDRADGSAEIAALRETLEETGILVGSGPGGEGTLSLNGDRREDGIRDRREDGTRDPWEDGNQDLRDDGNQDLRDDGILPALRSGKMSFLQALERLGRPALPASLPLIGHWVTPVQERYRYDTLFFGVQVPSDCRPEPDGQELVEGLWIRPAEALARNRAGELPMVFPTLETLEAMSAYSDPAEALTELSRREIPRLLPKVEETRDGIRMVV